MEEWSDRISNMHKCTKSVAMKETVVKLHTRWYYTPSKLLKFFPTVSKNCFRGCPEKGIHLHIFWSCITLGDLWQKVASKVTGVLTNLTHQMCLFFAEIHGASPPEQKLDHTLFSAVHWTISLFWRTPGVPWDQVLKRTAAIQLMEKVFHAIMDTMHIYELKWKAWAS